MPFDPVLSETARQSLLKLNVEVRLDQAVTMCDAKGADGQGKPLPGVASVAKQQGEYIARLLIKRARGGEI